MLDFIQLGLAALFNMPPTAATRGQRGGGGCDGEMKHAGSQKKWRQKRRDGKRRRKNEGQRQKWSLFEKESEILDRSEERGTHRCSLTRPEETGRGGKQCFGHNGGD